VVGRDQDERVVARRRELLGRGDRAVEHDRVHDCALDMVRTALTVLARHDDGFVLMVESELIDKYSHPLDWHGLSLVGTRSGCSGNDGTVPCFKNLRSRTPSMLVGWKRPRSLRVAGSAVADFISRSVVAIA
jgi:hypothetical protein